MNRKKKKSWHHLTAGHHDIPKKPNRIHDTPMHIYRGVSLVGVMAPCIRNKKSREGDGELYDVGPESEIGPTVRGRNSRGELRTWTKI